jgi:hypothetical protein
VCVRAIGRELTNGFSGIQLLASMQEPACPRVPQSTLTIDRERQEGINPERLTVDRQRSSVIGKIITVAAGSSLLSPGCLSKDA